MGMQGFKTQQNMSHQSQGKAINVSMGSLKFLKNYIIVNK